MPLSPAAAAEIAGVSRSLISKEIKNGRLRAIRNNSNHLEISQEDLDEWMSRRTARAKTPKKVAQEVDWNAMKLAEVEVEMREVRVQLNESRRERDDARQERDDWKAQAQTLAKRSEPEPRRIGFIERIFSRR